MHTQLDLRHLFKKINVIFYSCAKLLKDIGGGILE